jgi:predicted DNA-binding transcriptional regulator AlpA
MPNDTDPLLDITALCARLGGSRPCHPTTVYRRVQDGSLPRPVRVGPRMARWRASEIDAALANLKPGPMTRRDGTPMLRKDGTPMLRKDGTPTQPEVTP